MKKYIFILLLGLFGLHTYSQRAVVYEELREMPTYPYADPDPVPKPGKIYPYFRFDSFSVGAVEEEWKMIALEND